MKKGPEVSKEPKHGNIAIFFVSLEIPAGAKFYVLRDLDISGRVVSSWISWLPQRLGKAEISYSRLLFISGHRTGAGWPEAWSIWV